MFIIENDQLKVTVKEAGAELCSLVRKEDNKEYIWQADPAHWNRHAPTLFPVVGTLNEKRGIKMGRHGFARDMTFKCVVDDGQRLVFELSADENTRAVYPYNFVLRLDYSLEGARLKIKYEVENKSDRAMPFSIGAHPAFNCDLGGGNVVLEFEKEEELNCLLLDLEKGLLNGHSESHFMTERQLKIGERTFDKDALVFKGLESSWIKIIDPNTDTDVKVDFKGFTHMGIWSVGSAPFVCIEPWYGVTDSLHDEGPLENKDGIVILQPHTVFDAEHGIEIMV